MNDDFEIKVTTTPKESSCGCNRQDDYDYEYDSLMNYKDEGLNQEVNDIDFEDDPYSLDNTNTENKELTMWENAYETTNETNDDCSICNFNDDNWTPCEECGNPRVVTYQKCVTCDENGNHRHKTMTVRIVKRF